MTFRRNIISSLKLWPVMLLVPVLLCLFQAPLIKWLLTNENAVVTTWSLQQVICQEQKCFETYRVETKNYSHLFLGHLLSSHQVFDRDGRELSPIGMQYNDVQEMWTNIFTYQVAGLEYVTVKAQRPQQVSLQGFVGIKPRVSQSSSISRLSSIGPQITFAANIISLLLLLVSFSFYLLSARVDDSKSIIFESSIMFMIVTYSLLAGHFLDSLSPDPLLRKKILLFFALSLTLSVGLLAVSDKWRLKALAGVFLMSGCGLYFGHQKLMGITLYSYMQTFALIFAIPGLSKITFVHRVLVFPLMGLDVLRTYGVIIPDFPPLYWSQFNLCLIYSLWFYRHGGEKMFSFLGFAYRSIISSGYLSKFSDLIHETEKNTENMLSLEMMHRMMPVMAKSVPTDTFYFAYFDKNDLPVCLIFQKHADEQVIIDSIQNAGAEFYRAMFFGTEHEHSINNQWSCFLTIKHQKKVLGAIACLNVDFSSIPYQGRELAYQDTKSRLKMLSQKIAINLATLHQEDRLRDKECQDKLETAVVELMLQHQSPNHFMDKLVQDIAIIFKKNVVLFKKIEMQGVPVAVHGDAAILQQIGSRPLNLSPQNKVVVGPAVVAFVEKRFSYIPDLNQILSLLHPTSQQMVREQKMTDMFCLPLTLAHHDYVLMLVGDQSSQTLAASQLQALKNMQPLFNAGMLMITQKSMLNNFMPVHVVSNMMAGKKVREEEFGVLIVADLKGSTKLAQKWGDKKWLDFTADILKDFELIGKKHDFLLQTFKWDAYFFTAAGDGHPEQADHLKALYSEMDAIIQAKFPNYFATEEAIPGEMMRVCVTEGDISRDIIEGKQNQWDIVGVAMAEIAKFESAVKQLSGHLFITSNSAIKIFPNDATEDKLTILPNTQKTLVVNVDFKLINKRAA